MNQKPRADRSLGVCILAGGLSSRMSRDKAGLHLWGKTLLRRVRDVALQLNCPVRVIRRDRVARCGPLGGVFTGLSTSRNDGELFLACDMPFVSGALLVRLRRRFSSGQEAIFTQGARRVGFPFVLSCRVLEQVRDQIDQGDYSLGELAEVLRACCLSVRALAELENINTPDELIRARARIRSD